MKKKEKRIRAYADIGSHGGIFMFEAGPVGDKYPKLLHIYKEKVTPDLKPVTIIYKV
jgi:hypothetical protein